MGLAIDLILTADIEIPLFGRKSELHWIALNFCFEARLELVSHNRGIESPQ